MTEEEETIQRLRRRSLPIMVGATLLALLASAVPMLQRGAARGRDQARLAALFDVNRALAAYVRDHGEPPPHVPDPSAGGWETSLDGCFLDLLVRDGYLAETRLDPVNNEDLQFRYHRYEADEYGNDEPFYVLALTGFEAPGTPGSLPPAARSFRLGGRDWGAEFPLALGGR